MVTQSIELPQQDNLADPAFGISNGQWNLLIIAVDQLASPRPSLVGIWLLITTPEIQKLTLVPIFPPGELDSSPVDTDWEKTFSMTSEQEPIVEFLDKVSEQVLWDEYLMIDKGGLVSILEIVTHHVVLSQESEVQLNKNVLPATGANVDLSLEGQVEIWKTICLDLSNITEPEDFAQLLNQIKPHIHTHIDLEDFSQNSYFEDESQFQLGCEFPTLTLKSP